jgi:hypothetical protein
MFAVLVLLALLFARGSLNGIFPGVVPRPLLFAAWSGALGGIAIGLKGVYDHRTTLDLENDPENRRLWDNELLPWHIGRPFSGIIVGIAVLHPF